MRNKEFATEFVGWLKAIPYQKNYRLLGQLRSLTVNDDAIVPELYQWITGEDDFAVITVAGLFALYPHHGSNDPHKNFGWSARQLKLAISPKGDSQGVEKQFRTLVESDPHKVEQRFMQTLDSGHEYWMTYFMWFIKMFKMHDVPVNWLSLFDALDRWDEDVPNSEHVKSAWARSFWGSPKTLVANSDDEAT